MSFADVPRVLILTPVKSAARHLDRYCSLIERLHWPAERLSVGMLEGDSTDDTPARMADVERRLAARAHRVTMLRKDFGFQIPAGLPRWTPAFQLARRSVIARCRNHLLFGALRDEDWVLWIDVDVVEYPPDTIHRLLAYRRDILHPHCVIAPGGATYDLNAWAGGGKQTMHEMRGQAAPVRLQSVGGTMLLVKADLHRDGLVFPPFRYGVASPIARNPHPVWGMGEIETEGFALMAHDMGTQCWGLPDFEILHADE